MHRRKYKRTQYQCHTQSVVCTTVRLLVPWKFYSFLWFLCTNLKRTAKNKDGQLWLSGKKFNYLREELEKFIVTFPRAGTDGKGRKGFKNLLEPTFPTFPTFSLGVRESFSELFHFLWCSRKSFNKLFFWFSGKSFKKLFVWCLGKSFNKLFVLCLGRSFNKLLVWCLGKNKLSNFSLVFRKKFQ